MTLNLMFRYPDLYQTGMAVAPVADLRLYDTIYQERYMGLPQDNVEDYREGSAITYADKLRGNLLVVHGSGDDNVHYQGTERLVNALVAANRPFTLMDYPNRSHCICEGDGTTLHLFSLLTHYLEQNLPPEHHEIKPPVLFACPFCVASRDATPKSWPRARLPFIGVLVTAGWVTAPARGPSGHLSPPDPLDGLVHSSERHDIDDRLDPMLRRKLEHPHGISSIPM